MEWGNGGKMKKGILVLLAVGMMLQGNPSSTNKQVQPVRQKLQLPAEVAENGWHFSDLVHVIGVTCRGIKEKNKENALVWSRVQHMFNPMFCLDIWISRIENDQKVRLIQVLQQKIDTYNAAYVACGKDVTSQAKKNQLMKVAQLIQDFAKKQQVSQKRKVWFEQKMKKEIENSKLKEQLANPVNFYAVAIAGYLLYKAVCSEVLWSKASSFLSNYGLGIGSGFLGLSAGKLGMITGTFGYFTSAFSYLPTAMLVWSLASLAYSTVSASDSKEELKKKV